MAPVDPPRPAANQERNDKAPYTAINALGAQLKPSFGLSGQRAQPSAFQPPVTTPTVARRMPCHTTNETCVQLIQPVTGHKFFLLFLFLLAYLVMYPYVGETGMRYYVFRLASAALTLMCVYAVSFPERPHLCRPDSYRGSCDRGAHDCFTARMVPTSVLNIVLSFAFDIFTIGVIFRRVFARERAEAERFMGRSAFYLLIGFSFAKLYAILAIDPDLMPSIWFRQVILHPVPVGFDFIYFSFWQHN